MVQSGMYDDLQTVVDKKVNQKVVSDELNAINCRALDGYMNTTGITYIRKSSFYLTDAIDCDDFVTETLEANTKEKADRVISILDTIENLNLVVKSNQPFRKNVFFAILDIQDCIKLISLWITSIVICLFSLIYTKEIGVSIALN